MVSKGKTLSDVNSRSEELASTLHCPIRSAQTGQVDCLKRTQDVQGCKQTDLVCFFDICQIIATYRDQLCLAAPSYA